MKNYMKPRRTTSASQFVVFDDASEQSTNEAIEAILQMDPNAQQHDVDGKNPRVGLIHVFAKRGFCANAYFEAVGDTSGCHPKWVYKK